MIFKANLIQPQYLTRLKNARFVFDYSITNLQFLQDNGVPFSQLFYLPVDFLQKKQPENTQSFIRLPAKQ